MDPRHYSSAPFGELAIPSIEIGYDSVNNNAFWGHNHAESYSSSFNDLLAEPSTTPYSISPATTPTTQSPERTLARTKSSPKSPPRAGSSMSSNDSEEERRKSRKREQNRESQRNFRRRQENRVKFLESKTLELEANSRQLRAENNRLKTELQHAHMRNDELQFAMMSIPSTPTQFPLDSGTTSHPQQIFDSPSLMPFDLEEEQQQQQQQQQQHLYTTSSMTAQHPTYTTAW